MAGFYIKRIIARSDSKEDAVVDFTSGLNIIQGRSDTGKSCGLKCMEFVFGENYDKLKNPFKESSGYDSESVVIGTEQYGDVTLSRKVGSGQVDVVADSEEIDDGIYVIKRARKEAVHDYVNQKIREANQRQKELAVQI